MANYHTILSQSKIFASISDKDDNCVIYQYDLNGSVEKEVFNFSNMPLLKTGFITQLHPSADGTSLYFVSDNAHIYVPSRRNIFKIPNNDSWVKQLTPGPNSGQIPPNVPKGTVKGRITDSNNNPYASAAIFMEGLPLQYSDANGYFTFNNVPQGNRWITGYRPGSLVFKSLPVYVTGDLTSEVSLIPESDYKINFENPVEYNNHIYYIENNIGLYKLDKNGENRTEILNVVGFEGIGGFDIAKQDGQIIFSDYRTGTEQQRGLYTCNKNGNNINLFLDFKQDFNWGGVSEVLWSPDKSKIAVKAEYNYLVYFVIFDTSNGNILGTVYFNDNLTKYNIDLYGWNPDGKWLLYSTWLDKPEYSTLAKIKVGNDGSLDPNNNINLLQNVNLRSACWVELSKPNNIVESKKKEIIDKVYISPNPTNDFLNIEFNLKEKSHLDIKIYNELGELVQSIVTNTTFPSGKNIIKKSISKLKQGKYFLIILENNRIINKKALIKS